MQNGIEKKIKDGKAARTAGFVCLGLCDPRDHLRQRCAGVSGPCSAIGAKSGALVVLLASPALLGRVVSPGGGHSLSHPSDVDYSVHFERRARRVPRAIKNI